MSILLRHDLCMLLVYGLVRQGMTTKRNNGTIVMSTTNCFLNDARSIPREEIHIKYHQPVQKHMDNEVIGPIRESPVIVWLNTYDVPARLTSKHLELCLTYCCCQPWPVSVGYYRDS